MRVYLAAAWSRQDEIKKVADRIWEHHEVTSRWLDEEPSPIDACSPEFLRRHAYADLRDVDDSDVVVRFTDKEVFDTGMMNPEVRKLLSAARMVEMGYALAKGKTVVVVGGHQNIFDYLGNVVHVETVDDLVKFLGER